MRSGGAGLSEPSHTAPEHKNFSTGFEKIECNSPPDAARCSGNQCDRIVQARFLPHDRGCADGIRSSEKIGSSTSASAAARILPNGIPAAFSYIEQ